MTDRRSIIVLGSLIGAMTLVSGLLLALEPAPIAPRTGISLNSLEGTRQLPAQLFQTTPLPSEGRWLAVVIHDSGTLQGSADAMNIAHERMGFGGLGYHFVLEDTPSAKDAGIVMGFRWQRQLPGIHSGGPDGSWFNRNAISICMIGDFDRQAPSDVQMQNLIWLVRQLQSRFAIPRDRIYVQTARGADHGSGRMFPDADFRKQLLSNY